MSDDMPYVVHESEMMLLGVLLKVFNLSNGMRIVDKDSFETFMSAVFACDDEKECNSALDQARDLIRGGAVQ